MMKIAGEALPWAGALIVLSLLLGLLVHPAAAGPTLLLTLFVLWFFRDPTRRTPEDPTALISPADGRVIEAGPRRLSIFLNVFNVHICRTPAAGTVEAVEHHAGRFLAAFRDEAADQNERTTIVLNEAGERFRFTLVAGLIARRIVCKVGTGQKLQAGERVGLIRFGSRVDVELPPGTEVAVAVGDRVVAGETIIARRPPGAEGKPRMGSRRD